MNAAADDIALLEIAVRLAQAAAAEILAIRKAGFTVEHKTDASPVTLADQRAEQIIVAGLRALTAIPVIAEEEVAAGKIIVPGDTYWLVDPLDGTREFAAGRAEFVVNIGLVRNRRAVLGAVANPLSGDIYCGIIGTGAWRHSPQGRRAISARHAPAEGLTVMASRHYQNDPKLAALLAGCNVAAISHIGSALKFCKLAEGLADFYPRMGPTMEWDTAAPQAVLEAAGGSTRDFTGATLLYGKPGFENPPFISRGLP